MDIKQVLHFWFGPKITVKTPKNQARLWWSKQPEVDQRIRQKFEVGLQNLMSGKHKDWLQTAQGRLAAIIVLDQFSRNIYRDTCQAFTQDSLALTWCLEGMERQQDLELAPIQRVFFYLPLEHSEELAMQNLSCQKFAELLDDSIKIQGVSRDGDFEEFYRYAESHRDVIKKFGRYPHRNRILGRMDTEEETKYLNTPGSGF